MSRLGGGHPGHGQREQHPQHDLHLNSVKELGTVSRITGHLSGISLFIPNNPLLRLLNLADYNSYHGTMLSLLVLCIKARKVSGERWFHISIFFYILNILKTTTNFTFSTVLVTNPPIFRNEKSTFMSWFYSFSELRLVTGVSVRLRAV